MTGLVFPDAWGRTRVKFASSLKGRLGWQGLTADEYRDDGPYVVSSAHFRDERIVWSMCPRVSQERYQLDANIQLQVGDLLLMKDGAALGKLAFVDAMPGPACLNSHLLLFRPKSNAFWPKYLYYYCGTRHFQDYILIRGTGATFLGVSQETIGNHPLALPDVATQRRIAEFLDRKTAAIDALIARKTHLVEVLQEKRQALITRAVTKGLVPNVPMKPSGVGWIGDVPAHWSVGRLKQHSRRVVVGIAEAATHAYVEAGGVPIIRSKDVQPNHLRKTDDTLRIADWFARRLSSKTVRGLDLLTQRTGEYSGVTAVVPPELDGCQCFTMLITTTTEELNPYFASLFINSRAGTEYFDQTRWGTAQPNISVPILQNVPIAVPPRHEQEAIVSVVSDADQRAALLTAKLQRHVEVLREYRAALVTDAVTGRIDVTKAAA